MKTMLASLFGHSMIDIGTQAIAGIGRRISTHGMKKSRTRRYLPISRPSGTPIAVAMKKPIRMRRTLMRDVDEVLVRQADLGQLLNTSAGVGTFLKRM